MKELNLGSSYNPTGDPLFYCPYFIRVDRIILESKASRAADDFARANRKQIRRISPEGNEKIFPSMTSAAEDINMSDEALRQAIRRQKMYHGYYWEYV